MKSINFSTPIFFSGKAESISDFISKNVETYLWAFGKKAYLLSSKGNSKIRELELIDAKPSALRTALKIISYCTIIIPAIALIAKFVLRSMNTYHISQKQPATQIPETQIPETQTPETQTPETQTPETQTPETQTPETQTPETQTPETQTPETQTSDKPYIEFDDEKNRTQTSETPLFPIKQESNEQTDTADKKDKEVQDQTSETLTSSVLQEHIEPSKSTTTNPIENSIRDFKKNWKKFHADNGIDKQVNKKINTESNQWKQLVEKIVISHLPKDIQNPNNHKNKERKTALHKKIGEIIDTINKAIIENCTSNPKITNPQNVRSLILPVVIEKDEGYRELLTEVVNALKEAGCIFQVNCDKKEEIRIWA